MAAIPPSPSELKELIPTIGSPFCEAFNPGIINTLQRQSDAISSIYSETLEFSPEFISKLCALDCISGGDPTDPTSCPTVTVTGTVKSRDTHLLLSFTALGATSGYDYEIFFKTVPADPWVSLTTGTTVGNVVTYDHVGLTNDQVYYYQLTAQKPTCSAYSGEISGTPRECQVLNISVSAQSNAVGTVAATVYDLDGEMQPGSTWQLFIALAGQGPGELLDDGIVGTDGACTPNQYPGVCFEGAVPSQFHGRVCDITAVVQQGGCSAYTVMARNVNVQGAQPSPPVIVKGGNTSSQFISWAPVAGAASYRVYARSLTNGSCLHTDDFQNRLNLIGTSFPIVPPLFGTTITSPAPAGVFGVRAWAVYVVAISSAGVASNPSNAVNTDAKGQNQCNG